MENLLPVLYTKKETSRGVYIDFTSFIPIEYKFGLSTGFFIGAFV